MRYEVVKSAGPTFAVMAVAMVAAVLTPGPGRISHGQEPKSSGAKVQRPQTRRPERPVGNDRLGPVRELFEGERAGSRLPAGRTPEKPAVLDSEAELNRVSRELTERFPNENIRGKLKEVDLREQKVLYFAWAGSGGDRLDLRRGRPRDGRQDGDTNDDRLGGTGTWRNPDVVFLFRPGLTRDLSSHFSLYALPRGASFRVETVRPADRPGNRPPAGDRPKPRPR